MKNLSEWSAPFIFQGYKILSESTGEDGSKVMRVRGKCQEDDAVNLNNRKYVSPLWDNVVGNSTIQESINARGVLGLLDHPKEGQTAIGVKHGGASHLMTEMVKNGKDVVCEFEILDTPSGLILQEYIRKGLRIGVSSRATGETYMEDGFECVKPDSYVFETFDFVYKQSVKDAVPELIEQQLNLQEENMAKVSKRSDYRDMERLSREIFNLVPGEVALDAANIISEKILDLEDSLHVVMEEDESLKTPAISLISRLEKYRGDLLDLSEKRSKKEQSDEEDTEKDKKDKKDEKDDKKSEASKGKKEQEEEPDKEVDDDDDEDDDKKKEKKKKEKAKVEEETDVNDENILSGLSKDELIEVINELKERVFKDREKWSHHMSAASTVIEDLKEDAGKSEKYVEIIEELLGRINKVAVEEKISLEKFLSEDSEDGADKKKKTTDSKSKDTESLDITEDVTQFSPANLTEEQQAAHFAIALSKRVGSY